MEWETIRKAFIAERQRLGLQQEDITAMPQPMVSKLERNKNLGPSVGTFVKAVEGMGLTLSLFFARIETQSSNPPPPVTPPPSVPNNDAALEIARDLTDAQRVALNEILDAYRRRLERDSGTDNRQSPDTEKSTTQRLEPGRTDSRQAPGRPPTRRPKPGREKR